MRNFHVERKCRIGVSWQMTVLMHYTRCIKRGFPLRSWLCRVAMATWGMFPTAAIGRLGAYSCQTSLTGEISSWDMGPNHWLQPKIQHNTQKVLLYCLSYLEPYIVLKTCPIHENNRLRLALSWSLNPTDVIRQLYRWKDHLPKL